MLLPTHGTLAASESLASRSSNHPSSSLLVFLVHVLHVLISDPNGNPNLPLHYYYYYY